MEVNKGDGFDAELHEAITQIPAPEEKLKGRLSMWLEQDIDLEKKSFAIQKLW